MKVNFNPFIKNNYSNSIQKNEFKKQNTLNQPRFSALECMALNNLAFCANNKPQAVYAFSRDNTILRFPSKTEAVAVLGVNYCSVTKCLEGDFHESNGYSFAYAKDVEIQREDGSVELDEKAVKRIRESFNDAKRTPVYAISIDGSVQRFNSLAIASLELEIPIRSISKVLTKNTHASNGYVFVSADELEMRDKKGALIYDKNGKPLLNNEVKIAQLERFSKSYRGPVCSIDCFGGIRRFEDENEVIAKFGRKARTARDLGERAKVFSKRIFVQENLIISRDEQGYARYDKDGNYIYDISKINKLLEVFEDTKIRPVKAKNLITGEVIEFECSSQAAQVLGITKQAINQNLNGKNKTASGYKFEYLYPRTIKKYTLITE